MKKRILYFLLAIICLVYLPNMCYGQDPDAATPSTPIEESPTNLFSNRTVTEEEPLDEYRLELSGQERIFTLRVGQPAPVVGTLFNTEAVAWLDTRSQYIHQYYMTVMNLRLNEVRTSARLHISTLELRLESQQQANNIILENLRSQIATYEENNRTALGIVNPRSRRAHRRRIVFISIASSLAAATVASYITYIKLQ
jgi:hypothetical protein